MVSFNVGDRVKLSPMWKYESAVGSVVSITKEYVVVQWDNVNGDWHYTNEQSQKMEILNGS